jgi:hypothetical protein
MAFTNPGPSTNTGSTLMGQGSPFQIGQAAASLVGFYGATPVAQRAAAIQAASVVSVSSNITIAASLTAWIVEVTNTLNALGIWKGSA